MRIASRLLLLPSPLSVALAARVARLSHKRTVLVLAARRPADTLLRGYQKAGADLEHVFVIDATGSAAATSHANVITIGGPTLLELIAKRADQVLRRHHDGRRMTVITDDLACFAQYNPAEAMQEILHYSFTHLMTRGTHLEYAATEAFQKQPLFRAIRPLFDEVVPIDGDGLRRPAGSAPEPSKTPPPSVG